MKPLMFVWPYGLLFWAAFIWAYAPEYRIVQDGKKAAKNADSRDAGSIRVIMLGGSLAMVAALPLAWVPALQFPAAWQPIVYALGVGVVIGASLLRRHCFRVLGASFTGDVRASNDQTIVGVGAYAVLRHPSYTAGILMNIGIGLALGSWASVAVLAIGSFAVYQYRITVEERALLAVVGEPYRNYMRTRRRLIPFVY